MFLKSLYLNQFRCYTKKAFDFLPEMNSIHGANARGKTSLLEAIYFLIAGQSFRTSQLSDLIQIGTTEFFLEAVFVKNGIEQTVKIANGKERKIFYNDTPYASISNLLGLLPGVVITPEDVALIKGAPQIRRQFLDLQSSQIDPLYVHHLVRYHRAMRHRNTLLRAKNIQNIEIWEKEMANSAAYLIQQRLQAVAELQESCRIIYEALSGEVSQLTLQYKTSATTSSVREYYLEQYRKLRERECLFGYTLSGPHKDDLCIAIGGKEVRFFASEGQQRSCVAALQLAVWKRLQVFSGENPLLLIDDVGVSLDADRRERLLQHVQGMGQLFLTSTQPLEGMYSRPVHLIKVA